MLNKQQKEAVNHLDSPLLILAGAGTGKTKTLTSRISHIIENKYAMPSQILAVTFTNKAAKEMISRVENELGGELLKTGFHIGTFHSISARILRKYADSVGLNSKFQIIDNDDQIRVIKRIILDKKIELEKMTAKNILYQISRWKDKAIESSDLENLKLYQGDFYEIAKTIYPLYQAELLRSNSCDFGDLILLVIKLLRENEFVRDYYRQKFKYILVDEYQDVNGAQYIWLKFFISDKNNICCVGDDDQSIYSFRGAEIKNILKFERDFENSKVIKLEQNYRSTSNILEAATSLISKNENRHSKILFSDLGKGEKITILTNFDDRTEASNILEEIYKVKKTGKKLENIAILIRAFHQTRSFEEVFLSAGVPYKIVGGLKFYDRKEIKDMIAYLRMLNSDFDILAFERVINIPKRGIGNSSFAKINNISREHNLGFIGAIKLSLNEGVIKGKAVIGLKGFLELYKKAKEQMDNLALSGLCDLLIKESGYYSMLKQDQEESSKVRLENLDEFIATIDEFNSVEEFLEHISLINERENVQDVDSVNILTLHGAKGLEFDTVFLPGWEEDLFPHSRVLNEEGSKGLEEERRLAYVGITRAKRKLYISSAKNRRSFTGWNHTIPSRFLNDLPEENIEFKGVKSAENLVKTGGSQVIREMKKNPFNKGDKVTHQKFGGGVVKSVIGDVVEVSFESGKTRFATVGSLR